jgi:hypothetical protein
MPLAHEWARRYGVAESPPEPRRTSRGPALPELFDKQDLKNAQNQPRYHFFEWLGAIVLYQATGYLSLIAKYQFEKHRRKQEILKKLREAEVLAVLVDRTEHGATQGPDLLMYARDFSDWFFCEVKGPRDDLRPEQERKFEALAETSGKPVCRLNLKWPPGPSRTAAGRATLVTTAASPRCKSQRPRAKRTRTTPFTRPGMTACRYAAPLSGRLRTSGCATRIGR